MNDKICWLITVLYQGTLLKCALSVLRTKISDDCAEYPMEPENREIIYNLLPEHVRECGPIVAVEEIFEVAEAHDGK